MFINIQVDKLEMEALQKAGTEIRSLVAIMVTALDKKTKIGEFEIPTISFTKTKKYGKLAVDCSPKALNIAVTVEPEFTADMIITYTKLYTPIAIPMVHLVAAIAAMDSKVEAAEKELKKKWLTKVETEEVKVEEAEAKAS